MIGPTSRRNSTRCLSPVARDVDDPDAEPSLGWTASGGHWLETPEDLIGNANAGDDREDEDEREPDVENEPSLGWTHTTNQTATSWHANNLGMTDLEEGVGSVRNKRPASKTGNRVLVGVEVF